MTKPGLFGRSSRARWRRLATVITALLLSGTVWAQPGGSLALVQTVALPEVRGRIDHMDIDLDGGRLFVAALGNNTVEVIDLRAGKRGARIEHLHEPQGVAYVPEAKRLFVANGEGGRVDIFAGAALAPVAQVDALGDADNVRYQPTSGAIYVGYDSALAILEAPTLQKVGDVKLAGHPESFQFESEGSRVFVNVPSAQQIAVVDRQKRAVVATWGLGNMGANFPMALDEANHRLLIATRRPAAILVFNTETGQRIASLPGCGDADDLFFDSARKQVYAICGEGVISIVQQRDADHYQIAGQIPTASGARTGLFVPAQGRLYVAVPAQRATPAEIRIYEVR